MFFALVLLGCDTNASILNCKYDATNNRIILDSLIQRNLVNLPPVFNDEAQLQSIDSVHANFLFDDEHVMLSAFSFSTKEIYLFLCEERCLSLKGYAFYSTLKKTVKNIEFKKEEGNYVVILSGSDRFTSDYPSPFSDTIQLGLLNL